MGLVKGIERELGAIAQPGEHLLCKQEVGGSIPPGSTSPVIGLGCADGIWLIDENRRYGSPIVFF